MTGGVSQSNSVSEYEIYDWFPQAFNAYKLHCTHINGTLYASTAPIRTVLRAQKKQFMHKKSNSGLSSSIESPGFLYSTFFTLILRNGKKNDLLNLNTRVQINNIAWMGWFFEKMFLEI